MAVKKWLFALVGAASAAIIAVALILAATQSPSPSRVKATGPAKVPARPVAQTSYGPAVVPASLVQVPAFGANPSALRMYLYVPHSLRPHPAIVVALTWCGTSGQDFYNLTGFSTLADEDGFIVIYPSSTRYDQCFDVSSPAARRHDGGSDPVSVMSMVTYTEREYHANTHRVYVTGASSGGMMTAVMLADYPDVFAAGAIFEGAPFGCMAAPFPDDFLVDCAVGQVIKTPRQWGDIVRAADPGYHGPRPRVQIWHGTADPELNYANFGQEIRQWTNVLGVGQTPRGTDHPQPGWTRTVYGTSENDIEVAAYSILDAGHVLPEIGMEEYAISFFGLGQG